MGLHTLRDKSQAGMLQICALPAVAALPSNLTWRSVRQSDSMKLPGTARISANSARGPDCAGRLAFTSCQRLRGHHANSDIGLQQGDFVGRQIEQRIDLRVDLGFQPRDLGCQRVDFGAAGGDPVFPIIAFLKRDFSLQRLFHFLMEGSKVGKVPPFLQLGVKLCVGRVGSKVGNAAGDRLLLSTGAQN